MPRPRLFAQRGGTFHVRRQASSRCREKLDARLLAFDDLSDARPVQPDLFSDFAERKTFPVGQGESLAAGLADISGFALKLALSLLYGLAYGLPLLLIGHTGSLVRRPQEAR